MAFRRQTAAGQPSGPAASIPAHGCAVMTAAISLTGVSKHFGGVEAVAGVSFDLEPGTITGLIGPNGAGKTTLLNLITGYLKPTAGAIAVNGLDVTGRRPYVVAAAGVARTYQNILLLDSETVASNVLIGCHLALQRRSALARVRQWRQRAGWDVVAQLLADLSLEDVAAEEVDQLPYGVRRRVEIARALASRPATMILDEPTAGMTREESDDIGSLIQQVREAGTTVLLVEHNVRLVRAICDEVLVLDWGRMIGRDTAERIWDNAIVRAAYLGEISDEGDEIVQAGGHDADA